MHQTHSLASYTEVAREYYDESLHPTCRNFRQASKAHIRAALTKQALGGTVLEVGAGYSVVAELNALELLNFERYLLLDSSFSMLSYSIRFLRKNTNLMVSDACRLPFADESVSVVVASLGDPFNCHAFWREAARCLMAGGKCIFTTPSYEWASSFRASSESELPGAAYFQLGDGRALYLPSNVLSEHAQQTMISQAGLDVTEITHVAKDSISKPISKKISDCDSVVTGYIATKAGKPTSARALNSSEHQRFNS